MDDQSELLDTQAARAYLAAHRDAHIAPSTLTAWCRASVFPNAQRYGSDHRGIWLIPRSDLDTAALPQSGRPPMEHPSDAAIAQRRSRARRRQHNAS